MITGTAAQADSDVSTHSEFEDSLTPDKLTALMRSTWTWDDRALRRDLSSLLVDLAAAQGDIADDVIATTLRARGLATGARFAADVLGPHLIADAGSALRSDFFAAASDPTAFDRIASMHRSTCAAVQRITFARSPTPAIPRSRRGRDSQRLSMRDSARRCAATGTQ